MDDENIKKCIVKIREDTELMNAWLCEKIAVYGTLDYTFFQWYFESFAQRLRDLEDVL